MAIISRLDRVMADRKMSLNELAEKVGITNVNLSKLKTRLLEKSLILYGVKMLVEKLQV